MDRPMILNANPQLSGDQLQAAQQPPFNVALRGVAAPPAAPDKAAPPSVRTSIDTFRTVPMWGMRFARVNLSKMVAMVDQLIEVGKPSFFIHASLEYGRLSREDAPRFDEINCRATFLLANATSYILYSYVKGRPLPRKTGAFALLDALCRRAAEAGHRVFFLGGVSGMAQRAGQRLAERYPGLNIVGVETPPQRYWLGEEELGIIGRIREAAPDILLLGMGHPRGEIWLESHLENLGVPVCACLGPEAFMIAAGHGPRDTTPQWLRWLGVNRIASLLREPYYGLLRVWDNATFLPRAMLHDLLRLLGLRRC